MLLPIFARQGFPESVMWLKLFFSSKLRKALKIAALVFCGVYPWCFPCTNPAKSSITYISAVLFIVSIKLVML